MYEKYFAPAHRPPNNPAPHWTAAAERLRFYVMRHRLRRSSSRPLHTAEVVAYCALASAVFVHLVYVAVVNGGVGWATLRVLACWVLGPLVICCVAWINLARLRQADRRRGEKDVA